MKQITYAVTEQITVKEFLQHHQYSRKSISAIKQNGALLVNGRHVTVRYTMHKNDEFIVQLPVESRSPMLISSHIPISVHHNDDYLIIVSKPPFMNTIPSRQHPHDSLIEAVYGYLESHGDSSVLHPVSRLDRDTSGLVVFSKHQLTHHLLTGKIEKYYHLLSSGLVKDRGNYVYPIDRASDSIITRTIDINGQHARTEYQRLHYNAEYDISFVRVKLHTGRTHQIRVHFSCASYPLIGDSLYGGKPLLNRQALHAAEVRLNHPITGEALHIRDDNPQDFETLLEDMEVHHGRTRFYER